MIRSMTAFARQEVSEPWGVLTLELRSVNHRYLDVSLRLPEELRVLETKLREGIQNSLSRGKVDCTMRYQPHEMVAEDIQLDEQLIQKLASASQGIEKHFKQTRPVSALEVMRWPGVLQQPEVEPEVLQNTGLKLLENALSELISAREREGEKLKQIIEQRCDGISEIVKDIAKLVPEIKANWRERLLTRLEEIKGELDETRLEQELAFMAQKIDVDEEIDRLTTHVEEVKRVLNHNKPVGRRLDFLMQELNREANTLGSKSTDARTGTASVDLKVLIEQMREQVQN
ncbi:MAG: YicC/YloC family endoribonuclease, partial [Thioalkalispiraceae bacterium]